jgi:hypothetical protein
LVIKDRLSTRNIQRRKNMHLDFYTCVLCNESVEETAEHLFLQCSFAKDCWSIINLGTPPHRTFLKIVDHFKTKLQSQFFMLAVILMCWTIWTARNDLILKVFLQRLGLQGASSSMRFWYWCIESSQETPFLLNNGHKIWCN